MEVNRSPAGDARDPATPRLAPRPLPRAGGETIAPLVWRVGPQRTGADEQIAVLRDAVAAGGWVYLPTELPDADLPLLKVAFDSRSGDPASSGPRPALVMGVRGEDLTARNASRVRERLAAMGAASCAAVMLEEADPIELKGGRAYQRLTQLRDAGVTRLIFLEAADVPNAEWLIENTAAHAVSLPLGIGHQTARHGLLDIAKEVGTAVLARRPARAVWNAPATWEDPAANVSFCLADPRVAAVVEPLPSTDEGLVHLLAAAATPMPDAAREALWTAFRQQVPKPARSRTGHPPEYGA